MNYKPHEALLDYLDTERKLPILDLACGTGRSGLILARRNIPVVFADRSDTALNVISQHLEAEKLPGKIWQTDLEQAGINPFAGQLFSAVVCFRYLHRPLFPYLMAAVEVGGLVIYETFTTENSRFGRPNNPDFLLRAGELKTVFQNWDVLHYYEGIQRNPDRAIAQIVARYPQAGNLQATDHPGRASVDGCR